jgi:hypothetical protein
MVLLIWAPLLFTPWVLLEAKDGTVLNADSASHPSCTFQDRVPPHGLHVQPHVSHVGAHGPGMCKMVGALRAPTILHEFGSKCALMIEGTSMHKTNRLGCTTNSCAWMHEQQAQQIRQRLGFLVSHTPQPDSNDLKNVQQSAIVRKCSSAQR